MLKKCLKYDLAAVFRVVWILIVVSFGAVVCMGAGLRCFTEVIIVPEEEPQFLAALGAMGGYFFAICCFIVAIAAAVVGTILVYWRMYSNFFTDEGYLTFTLPVKRSTLYLSKVLTCSIVEMAGAAACLLGGLIAIPIAIPTEGFALINVGIFTEIPTILTDMWNTLGVWPVVWVLLIPPMILVGQLANCGLTFLCITLGAAIFKKGKLIAAVGIYWLVNNLSGVVVQFVSFPLAFGMSGIMLILASESMLAGLAVTLVFLITIASTACGAAILHFINLTLLERKLNLA